MKNVKDLTSCPHCGDDSYVYQVPGEFVKMMSGFLGDDDPGEKGINTGKIKVIKFGKPDKKAYCRTCGELLGVHDYE